jgi:hypothetical protein
LGKELLPEPKQLLYIVICPGISIVIWRAKKQQNDRLPWRAAYNGPKGEVQPHV